jgi:UDP-N-acetyl-2-amino-2-deoxyglucuronate dehydrogenase
MLKVALVGCGRISRRHSDLLGGGKIDGARLVAVCDIDILKAIQLGQAFNVPHYEDYNDMMLKEDIDLVVVLTESGNHAKHVIDLAKYRKHLVVEKPMALTLSDADQMIKVCSENGIKLFVVKQNRFNSPIIMLREALQQGKFGKLLLGTVRVRWCRTQDYYNQASWRGTWALDGGVLSNQASHHIDMLEWMMGEVDELFAYGATHLAKIEAEDTSVVSLKFKNGALGTIEATTASRPIDLEGSISVMGENGVVEVGGFAMNEIKVWKFNDGYGEIDIKNKYSSNPPNVYGFGHLAFYDHVVKEINHDGGGAIDGAEGRKSLEIIHAIYESIETGLPIKVGSQYTHSRLGR